MQKVLIPGDPDPQRKDWQQLFASTLVYSELRQYFQSFAWIFNKELRTYFQSFAFAWTFASELREYFQFFAIAWTFDSERRPYF